MEQTGAEYLTERGMEIGKRKLLLAQLVHRFGALPRDVKAAVNRLREPEITQTAIRALDIQSLDELGLTGS